MMRLTEHELKALQHARDIRFRQFRWLILAAPLFAFAAGSLWNVNRHTSELPRPPIQKGELPPRSAPKEQPSPPQEQPHKKKPTADYRAPSSNGLTSILISVVHIDTPSGSGSGVVIYSDQNRSFILTAAHVVSRDTFVTIGNMRGRVFIRNKRDDLALVEVEETLPPVDLAKRYAPGDKVWAAAFPRTQVVGEGWITSVDSQLRATTPTYPGMSGGGLFVYDDGYKLVGIIIAVGMCAEDCLRLNDTRAVSLATIKAFLRRTLGEGS
jgi:hypothetical protein